MTTAELRKLGELVKAFYEGKFSPSEKHVKILASLGVELPSRRFRCLNVMPNLSRSSFAVCLRPVSPLTGFSHDFTEYVPFAEAGAWKTGRA